MLALCRVICICGRWGVVQHDGGSGCVGWGGRVVLGGHNECPGLVEDREEWHRVLRYTCVEFGGLGSKVGTVVTIGAGMGGSGPAEDTIMDL